MPSSFVAEIQTIERACSAIKGQIPQYVKTWLYDVCGASFASKGSCCVCDSTDEKIELHHVAGRKHDIRTVPVCIECHNWLSLLQMLWDKRWLRKNNIPELERAFFMQGLCDLLLIKGQTKLAENKIYFLVLKALIPKVGYLLECAI